MPRGRPRNKSFKSAFKSANLIEKTVKKGKRNKKDVVAKSFAVAYNKMIPSKEHRYDLSDVNLFTSGTLADRTHYVYLDNIAQGSQLNQRMRNSIHASYLWINGTIQNNSTVKAKFIRVLIVREINQGDFVSASMTNLLRGVGTATAAPSGFQGDGILTVNRDNYIKLFDKKYKVPIESEGTVIVKEKIRLNQKIFYPQNLTAGTTPIHGSTILLVMLFDGDNSTSATTVCWSAMARLFFKDYNKPYNVGGK